jgi:hypothetical protein
MRQRNTIRDKGGSRDLPEAPGNSGRPQARISTGCIESFILGAYRPLAEPVLGANTASAARVHAIQLE